MKVLSERSKSALIRLMNDGSLEKITKNKFRIRIKDTTICNEILHRIIRLEQFFKGDLIEKNEFFTVIRKLLEQQPLSYEEKRFLCRFVIAFSQKAQTLKNMDLKNTNYPLIVLPKKAINSLNVSRNDNLTDVQKSLMICEFFYNKCKCTYERVPDEFLNKIRNEFFPNVPDSIDTRDIEYFFGNTFVFIDKAFQKLKELAMLNMTLTNSKDSQIENSLGPTTLTETTLPNFRSLETSIRAEGIDFPELTDYGLHKNPDHCGQNQIILKAENAPELPNEREGENLSLPYLKALPSQPKIIQANFTPNKIEFPDDCGEIYIAFTCDMDLHVQERIFSFEAFAFMESLIRPKSDWEKIGEMKFFELPMMMKLHRIKKGFKYFFALRAIDIRKRAGPYSFPLSLQT